MKALLVMDPQKGFLEQKDFTSELSKITEIIQDFKKDKQKVIIFKHIDSAELSPDSPVLEGSEGSEIYPQFKKLADQIIEKTTPSGFKKTNLQEILQGSNINHIFIVGFNTEFCCLFTAISGDERGYKVTFIEDATGTVNTDATYEMPGLDIRDMVGSILNWSNQIEVLYYDEYVEKYRKSRCS